jgi:hypothetical protein
MKTLVSLLAVAMILGLLPSTRASADNNPNADLSFKTPAFTLSVFTLKEEAYIDDIPFSTEKIFKRACCYYKHYGRFVADLTLPDEEYIDDIPFNTKDIASTRMTGEMLNKSFNATFNLDDELYIDDIPFDTKEVAADSIDKSPKQKTEEEDFTITSFNLKDEEYIDDIPWDTKQFFAQKINYPDFARKMQLEGTVTVSFHYNEDGYIEVEMADSNSDYLKDYVISTIEEIKLSKGIVSVGKEYIARFDFKLQ